MNITGYTCTQFHDISTIYIQQIIMYMGTINQYFNFLGDGRTTTMMFDILHYFNLLYFSQIYIVKYATYVLHSVYIMVLILHTKPDKNFFFKWRFVLIFLDIPYSHTLSVLYVKL